MTKNNRGWRGESRRHSLARRGIKTATDNASAAIKIPQGKRSYFTTTSGTKMIRIATPDGKVVIVPERFIDSDGDGMPDNLDCDPNDPEKQGFFDNMKRKVVESVKGVPDDVKLQRLRNRLEEREEALEKKKESTLLKLDSKTEEKRGIAEIKAKEKELDRIQEELEEGSFKQKLRLGLLSSGKKAGILAKKGVKRLGEELAEKTPKKFTAINLTDKEKAITSTATQKRLSSQEKKNAELEAQITLKTLKKEEKSLKAQLSTLQTKRKKKKKDKGLGLFD